MSEEKIRVDKDLRPAYYDEFHCIMGACRYNCCDDSWSITFSKGDYLKLKRAPKSPQLEELTGKCLRRIREESKFYAEFHSSEAGRCAFHSPEGLCRLQLECGEEVLPKVCRTFPRSEGYMPSGYLERSLSPACEGVLAQLWDLPEGIGFRSDPLPKAKRKMFSVVEDNPLPYWFPVIREWCVDTLQDRRFTLPQRIFLMGMGLRELADGEEDIDRWMKRAAVLPGGVDTDNIPPTGAQELTLCLVNCVQTLLNIRAGDANQAAIKEDIEKGVGLEAGASTGNITLSQPLYQAARARFEERFAGREYFWENLMVAALFHLHMPSVSSREDLWKGYVDFCNLYAFYRFLSVMSCREGAPGDREELFRLIVFASRNILHNDPHRGKIRDELFENGSATLAHMAILLCG